MKLISIKSASEIQLAGIKAEFVTVNKSNRILMLTDVNGRKVNITRLNSYDETIDVQVTAPPTTEEKWQVLGDMAGVPVCETFDDEHKATRRKNDLVEACHAADLRVEPFQAVVEEV